MDASAAPAYTPGEESKIAIGNLSVNLEKKTVKIGLKICHIEKREFEVLAALCLYYRTAPLTIVTKQMLHDLLYAEELKKPDIRVIRVFICNLRSKIDTPEHNSRIETVGQKGYRMRRPPDPLPVEGE